MKVATREYFDIFFLLFQHICVIFGCLIVRMFVWFFAWLFAPFENTPLIICILFFDSFYLLLFIYLFIYLFI